MTFGDPRAGVTKILRDLNHRYAGLSHPNRSRVAKHMRRHVLQASRRSNPTPKRLVNAHNLIAVVLDDVTTKRDAFCLEQLVINFVCHRHRRAPLDLAGRLAQVDQAPVEIDTIPSQLADGERDAGCHVPRACASTR